MRKIEILQYSCPTCNAELICQAVDFSNDSTGRTRSTYKCAGCMEEFYSVEHAYIAEPEKTPELACLYCEKQCTYLSLRDDWTDYWKCLPCKVSYEKSFHPNHGGIQVSNMYTTLNNKLYVLRQYYLENRSRVEMLPEDEEDTVVIARVFPFLMPTVNPTNIRDKILTYLVFS